MPTEPSREAVETWEFCPVCLEIRPPGRDHEHAHSHVTLMKFSDLAIELEKARKDWEQEVRERLLSDAALYAFAMHGQTVSMDGPGAMELRELRQKMAGVRDSIFGEAEPVEEAGRHDFKLAEKCPTCGKAVDGGRIDERITNVRFNHPSGISATEGISLPLALEMAADNGGSVDVFLSDHDCWFPLVQGPAWRIQTLRAALSDCQSEAEPVEGKRGKG